MKIQTTRVGNLDKGLSVWKMGLDTGQIQALSKVNMQKNIYSKIQCLIVDDVFNIIFVTSGVLAE